MSFRPFNSNFWHAALAVLVCLAFGQAARAGEGARDIEIVPFHSTINTNFDQSMQNDAQTFSVWKPTAPSSVKPATPQPSLAPLPHPQPTLNKEEQQLLERRRNWVFMTPEDYATADPKNGKNSLGADNNGEDNMTAMERYYRHLEQSNKPVTTNEFSQLTREGLNSQTNYFNTAVKNTDPGMFGQVPFNSKPDEGVFQSITKDENVFGNSAGVMVQSPEEIRIQAEQKAHMENFKQLWNIDQAASAAAPVATPVSGPIDSSALFGSATPGMASPFKPIGAIAGDNSSGASAKPTPAPQPAPPRNTAPPHSDFTPMQRPF